MAHTRKTLEDFKKGKLISSMLNQQSDLEKFMKKFCERVGNLSNTLDYLSSKLDQTESSLLVNKTVNDNPRNSITSLERSIHVQV